MNKTVTIVGQGYVGLPLALTTANSGWKVFGLEIDSERLERLQTGTSLVEDVSDHALKEAIQSGKYVPTANSSVISESSIVILCVPTPLDEAHQPDLSYLKSAALLVGRNVTRGTLIINESTSHPGTLRDIIRPAIQSVTNFDIQTINFASSPERIDPGNSKWHLGNTPRVVGGLTKEAESKAVAFYSTFCSQVSVASTPEVAEMAKMLENSFRLINISFINELSTALSRMNIDMREVVKLASTKPYGFMPFFPSGGIGGHCIPVDPYYLDRILREKSFSSEVLGSALKANEDRPKYILDRAIEITPTVEQILLFGVAYKAGIGDYRESAAEKIALDAIKRNIQVYWHDPLVTDWKLGTKWSGEEIGIAIYLVDQPGQIEIVSELKCQIIDCTGQLKRNPNSIQV